MDSTYNLTAEQYPLYILAAQDGNSFTRPVAVCFVTQDTKALVSRFLQLFQEVMEPQDIQRIRTVFIDKDKRELGALKDELPHVRVLLCWFHVIRAIKKDIAALEEETPLKKKVFEAFRQLLYAATKEEFTRRLYDLTTVSPRSFFEYYSANWDCDRELWAHYERKDVLRLGNNTTNRVEAVNRAVKAVFKGVQRTRMKVSEAVSTLIKFLLLTDASSAHTEFLNHTKRTYVNDPDLRELLAMAGNFLTPSAVRLLVWQLRKYELEKKEFERQEMDHQNWTVTHTKINRTYSQQVEETGMVGELSGSQSDRITCSCAVNSTFGLPCKHIFFLRQHNEEETLELNDCLPRWLRRYTGPDVEFLSSALCIQAASACLEHDMDDLLDVPKEMTDTLSEQARYTQALAIAKKLCSTISMFGGKSYQSCLQLLQTVRDAIDHGVPPANVVGEIRKRLLKEEISGENAIDDCRRLHVTENSNENEKYGLGLSQKDISDSTTPEKGKLSRPLQDANTSSRAGFDHTAKSGTVDVTQGVPFNLPGHPIQPPGRPRGRHSSSVFNTPGKKSRKFTTMSTVREVTQSVCGRVTNHNRTCKVAFG